MRRVHPRLRPWHVVVITLVGSIIGGALCAAAALRSRGRMRRARLVRLIGLPLGTVLVLGLCALPLSWVILAWVFLAINVAAGAVFAWALRGTRLPRLRDTEEPHGTGWSAVWGVLGGGSLASYIGGGAGVAYLLATDLVVSTVFPSIAGRFSALLQFLLLLFNFTLIGSIVGGILGAKRPHVALREIAWALAGSICTYYLTLVCWTVLIGIPAFQGYRLAPSSGVPIPILVVFWMFHMTASVFGGLVFADRVLDGAGPRWRSLGLIAGVVSASMLSLALYAGRLSYDYLLIGQLWEKRSQLTWAQRCYELGLAQRPDGEISSYLQFRVGLLYRKLGQTPAAKTALSKVVTKYTKRPRLVAVAQQFLTAIDHALPQAARRVIPGIETPTEFKSAYCVPNSLGLVLHYWHIPVSPKAIGQRITSIDFGTTIPDALWYVQTRGLQHWVLPLASIEDVKRLLDQHIPLLLYIPRHVLAVFGYDEALNSLVTYDVAEEDIWVDHPIEELVPQWKEELATIGIVLPPDRLRQLPLAEQQRLARLTRAYVHHQLHAPYHYSRDPADQDRALAHLEASMALAPEFFFDLAHVYVRPHWGGYRREALAARYDLRRSAETGLAFARYQFMNDEVLRELALVLLDVGAEDVLLPFLDQRLKEGTLTDQEELIGLLGILEYRRGNFDAAIAELSTLKHQQRYPMVLARALERTNAWQGALNEYQRVLELKLEDEDGPSTWAEYLANRALEVVSFPRRTDRMAASLHIRRDAMRRVTAITEARNDPERFRIAARTYLKVFPWDADVQWRYSTHLAQALTRDALAPADQREDLSRELAWSLGILRSLDLRGERRGQLDALEARAQLR